MQTAVTAVTAEPKHMMSEEINMSTADDGGRWTPLGADGPAKRRRLDLDSPSGSGSADIVEDSEAAPTAQPSMNVVDDDDDADDAAAEADTEDANDATYEPEAAQAAPAAPKSTGCK